MCRCWLLLDVGVAPAVGVNNGVDVNADVDIGVADDVDADAERDIVGDGATDDDVFILVADALGAEGWNVIFLPSFAPLAIGAFAVFVAIPIQKSPWLITTTSDSDNTNNSCN